MHPNKCKSEHLIAIHRSQPKLSSSMTLSQCQRLLRLESAYYFSTSIKCQLPSKSYRQRYCIFLKSFPPSKSSKVDMPFTTDSVYIAVTALVHTLHLWRNLDNTILKCRKQLCLLLSMHQDYNI